MIEQGRACFLLIVDGDGETGGAALRRFFEAIVTRLG